MMENDWRHSQCSKVELNLRVTTDIPLAANLAGGASVLFFAKARCASGVRESGDGGFNILLKIPKD
jgi:hypothetical protein